ncbi:MAG: asparagine synthase (glutamine-hydrolyzing) [Elusimicrobiota bacterium]
MCGLAGIFRLDGERPDLDKVRAACSRLAHRGPDDAGEWSEGPVALGFRRLSILDLERGAQPMRSECGRFTLVYNGEIYNHPELKQSLERSGVRYRTCSDAETLLHLLSREGAAALGRLEGMFAFALWDSAKHEMLLARDPLGVKPLYYSFDGSSLAFASELRSLAVFLPGLGLDPAGVVDYLCYGYVHSPRTALLEAMKLPPGHLLRLNAHGLSLERYWEMPRPPRADHGPVIDAGQALCEIEERLIASVRGQLLSDVPLGAFLSGGVDSALVTALMVKAGGGPVRTFSIGFSGARGGVDETAHARAVARFLGTDHQELILPVDVLDRTQELAECLDEPIADSAILPTHLLSRFARGSVKAVLTGEGADELFAGYNRYKAAYLSERIRDLPRWGRPFAAALARRMGKGRVFAEMPHDAVSSWARSVAHSEPAQLRDVCRLEFLHQSERFDPLEWLKDPEEPHSLGSALAFDLRTVLCDCLLMKVDKAAMRASLEARVPYLDRRVVEYAMRLPPALKMRWLKGKYVLRKLAAKYLPKRIAFRRKHGFIVPWEEWVRRPDNPLLDDLLRTLEPWGVFETGRLRVMLEELRAGSREVDAGIFYRVMVFGLWLDSMRKRC